ncbi:MAG: zinc transporter ZupT [Euryarchaeota archaeon]|nr:zinc transporter ZupT [Euryarchaeota archaeon]
MDVYGNIGPALLLTIFAGLSTCIGGAIAYFIKKPKLIYLSFVLGFSAGVMIYISFMELLPRAIQNVGEILSVSVFFVGILVIAFIDMSIPWLKNPHHYKDLSDFKESQNDTDKEKNDRIMRTGLFTAFAITLHNFPEGLATMGATLVDVKLGIFIALAVAIHNIPEGISVSVPIYYATHDKKKAFLYSCLSGVAEPIAAVIGVFVLLPFLSATVLASLLAFAAGIMVYISIDELLPMAHRYGHSHVVIAGIVLGMFIMAISLFSFSL